MHIRPRIIVCALLGALPLHAQNTLDRTPLLSGGWVGLPGSLQVNAPFRFSGTDRPNLDVFVVPTFQLALGLPNDLLIGGQYAAQSQVAGGGASEWEAFARWRPLAQQRGFPADISLQGGWNGAAQSVDGELSAARWMGPLRLIAAGRVFSDAFGAGEARGAVAGGVVFYPLPRSMPVALAGDVGMMLDEDDGEDPAWSASVQVGIPYTVNTISLFATNTGSGTLQGVTRGGGRTRWGVELTLPIPAGAFLGWYAPREQARRAVTRLPDPPPSAVQATIYRYAFVEDRIEITAGTTITWTNRDAMVHTVAADDGSWNSGAIQPGATWSATFSEPGIYPYHCGPHPFMKGTVIVR